MTFRQAGEPAESKQMQRFALDLLPFLELRAFRQRETGHELAAIVFGGCLHLHKTGVAERRTGGRRANAGGFRKPGRVDLQTGAGVESSGVAVDLQRERR